MNNRQSPHYCCLLLDQACKKYGIERRIVDMGESDVLEAFDFYSKANNRIGFISFNGIISLGNMRFEIESEKAWEAWRRSYYGNQTMQNAIYLEVQRVLQPPCIGFFKKDIVLTPKLEQSGFVAHL